MIETKTNESSPLQYDAQEAVVFASRILTSFSGLASKF